MSPKVVCSTTRAVAGAGGDAPSVGAAESVAGEPGDVSWQGAVLDSSIPPSSATKLIPSALRCMDVLQSKFRMQPDCGKRHGPPVAVVGGVAYPLVVKAQMSPIEQPDPIIGLEDLLGTGMRQPPVTHEDPQAAEGEICLAGP